MEVHDVAEQERITEEAVADGVSADHFDTRLAMVPNDGENLLKLFLQPEEEEPTASSRRQSAATALSVPLGTPLL